MVCLSVILLCYRITCFSFCNKKGHYLCQTLYYNVTVECSTALLQSQFIISNKYLNNVAMQKIIKIAGLMLFFLERLLARLALAQCLET